MLDPDKVGTNEFTAIVDRYVQTDTGIAWFRRISDGRPLLISEDAKELFLEPDAPIIFVTSHVSKHSPSLLQERSPMIDPDKTGKVFGKHKLFSLPALEKIAQEKEKTCEHCAWCSRFHSHETQAILQKCENPVVTLGANGRFFVAEDFACNQWESK